MVRRYLHFRACMFSGEKALVSSAGASMDDRHLIVINRFTIGQPNNDSTGARCGETTGVEINTPIASGRWQSVP